MQHYVASDLRLAVSDSILSSSYNLLLDHQAIKHEAILQDSDREKLHLARQRHAFEERQAGIDALKERRKEERAAKRAARREAAVQESTPLAADLSDAEEVQPLSRNKVTVGSSIKSR